MRSLHRRSRTPSERATRPHLEALNSLNRVKTRALQSSLLRRVQHAELAIGDSVVMLFDSRRTLPTHLRVYVDDVHEVLARGESAGRSRGHSTRRARLGGHRV
ncbi:MAG: hypothetical protein K0Q52_3472 [Microbacterium sp.]|nr:hypothetical protein [Microbacterium sp.]